MPRIVSLIRSLIMGIGNARGQALGRVTEGGVYECRNAHRTSRRLSRQEGDQAAIARAMAALENQFALSAKATREPETLEIFRQLFERALSAYGSVSGLSGKRILDIACGSRTSRAPSWRSRSRILSRWKTVSPSPDGYTALFEPWFCRILLALGARPVGIDKGDLSKESFEHYQADLGFIGALDFLPSRSFDAVHDSRLFGSPEFTTQFSDRHDALRIAREIVNQERRLLNDAGIVIHSDAQRLVGEEVAR